MQTHAAQYVLIPRTRLIPKYFLRGWKQVSTAFAYSIIGQDAGECPIYGATSLGYPNCIIYGTDQLTNERGYPRTEAGQVFVAISYYCRLQLIKFVQASLVQLPATRYWLQVCVEKPSRCHHV